MYLSVTRATTTTTSRILDIKVLLVLSEVLTIYKFPEPAVVSREVPDILISKDDIEIIQVDISANCI